MLLSTSISRAASLCIEKRLPFAVYMMPGSDHAIFLAGDESTQCNSDVDRGFFISEFNTSRRRIVIAPQYTAEQIIENADTIAQRDGAAVKPVDRSTPRDKYDNALNTVVNSLKLRGGKTVISRVICGDAADIDWLSVAEKYFTCFPSTFRYLYYTAATGAWIGASPELLLECDNAGNLSTMSLAGTRMKSSNAAWDDKNREEHDYVTRYIVDKLSSLGINATVGCAENVGYGAIEHLCHRITARYTGNPFIVADTLSPTPALAGTPLDKALNDITLNERHPRRCYGGYVGMTDSRGTHIFVNLRCVHFDESRYCIYAGGGITAKSESATEWDETSAKSQVLLNAINQSRS